MNRKKILLRWLALLAPLAVLAMPVQAKDDRWDKTHVDWRVQKKLVVFGDSLSDTGNKLAIRDILNEPPYDQLNQFGVPSDPYALSGNFTNGLTWLQHVALTLGIPDAAEPAASGHPRAGNYAWGGARAFPPPPELDPGNRHLREQVETYLADVNHDVSPDTLHVIFIGGNDVITSLLMLAQGFPAAIGNTLNAATAIEEAVNALSAAGARRFLIMNAPSVGLMPALTNPGGKLFAGCLATLLNEGSTTTPECPFSAQIPVHVNAIAAGLIAGGAEVTTFDAFGFITSLAGAGEALGFKNVSDPCVMPNLAPFACGAPNGYLFWDGIHPSAATHRLLGSAVLNALGH